MSGCEVKRIVKLSFPYLIICVLLLGGVELLVADGSAQSAPAHPHSRFPRLSQVPAPQESNRNHLQVKYFPFKILFWTDSQFVCFQAVEPADLQRYNLLPLLHVALRNSGRSIFWDSESSLREKRNWSTVTKHLYMKMTTNALYLLLPVIFSNLQQRQRARPRHSRHLLLSRSERGVSVSQQHAVHGARLDAARARLQRFRRVS